MMVVQASHRTGSSQFAGPTPREIVAIRYAQAMRHSRFVRFLRWAIPIGSVLVLVGIIGVAVFDPFRTIAQDARLSSILLIAVTLAALVWANSPWGASYDAVWERPTAIGFRRAALTLTVREWINDALMAVFFLVVGLEIERELLVGTLRDIRAAALPIAAALRAL